MRAADATPPITTNPVSVRPLTVRVSTANTPTAPAEAVTPRTSGLASGLRSTTWKTAPASPSAAPTTTAAVARGILTSHTT
ncbi:hypothetical protein SRABI128_02605 [Microbacterium sp. Bi128]|nr:hypothetical protein SRABI128_02605 [Microbacterium sp. Bi128]